MLQDESPIRDFYPSDFEVDMNGKRNPWEGVNLLSFINESRLKDAIAKFAPDEKLSEDERERNSFGVDIEYSHDISVQSTLRSPHTDKTNFVMLH